jgi:hypothetical protein
MKYGSDASKHVPSREGSYQRRSPDGAGRCRGLAALVEAVRPKVAGPLMAEPRSGQPCAPPIAEEATVALRSKSGLSL